MGWNRSHPKVIQGTESANWAWVPFLLSAHSRAPPAPVQGQRMDVWDENTSLC